MSIDSKKIAKNTIILYLRMFVLLIISLYTSRIVLDVLGVDDFGIYNVVGGIVMILGFLNGTMSTASSRFITVALSGGNLQRMKTVFSSVFIINMMLSFIVVVIAETFGLWFFYNKLQIPAERIDSAFWVYQISILTVVINIISVPYNAAIIAHERMKAFAYITMFDGCGKLLMVYLIQLITFDRLIVYAICMFTIQLVDRFIFGVYCKANFKETYVEWHIDKKLLKDIMSFISWSSYGSFATVGFTHGLNILLNMFFGPAVNASRAIAVQVQSNVVAFTSNFLTAVNPQLIKSTAQGDFISSRKILLASSKYSFILLCMLGFPILTETHLILSIWLKEVPDYAVEFVQIMLVISIWSTLAYPLRIVNQAEGHIKKYQMYECTILLMIVPLSYIVLKIFRFPILVFVVHLFVELLVHFVRLKLVLPKVNMKFIEYFKLLYIRLVVLFVILSFFAFIINYYIPETLGRFFLSLIGLEIVLFIASYKLLFTSKEKLLVKSKVLRLFE